MNRISLYCVLAAGALAQVGAGSAAAADAETSGKQARIPFADLGGIRSWRADENDTLFVESRRGDWYRAELLGPCIGLRHSPQVGFVFEPDGSFDRFSSVVVNGRECQIKSLVKSDPPADADKPAESGAAKSGEAKSSVAKSGAPDSPAQSQAQQPTSAPAAQNADNRDEADDARIPFAHLGGIENWRATDDDTLYIEGRRDQWYRAELFGFCPGLRFETTIGFVTQPVGGFDEFSSIVVDGRECQLKSLTKSGPPPKKS